MGRRKCVIAYGSNAARTLGWLDFPENEVMKIPVAVVGATGIAGQQVLAALDGHPTFQIAALAASERSAGRNFAEAITDAQSGMRRWYVAGAEPPADALRLEVQDAKALRVDGVKIVFAAVESEAARALEPIYARHVPT